MTEQTITDMIHQIRTTVEANGAELAEGIDVRAVAREIEVRYGRVDVSTIGHDEFWTIVAENDVTQR